MPHTNASNGPDRRVAPRLPVCWTGLVAAGTSKQTCMVRDLSPTGASLGHVAALKRSQLVSLEVRHGKGELALAARVMWIDELTHTAGVAFLGAGPDAIARLREALGAAVARLRGGSARPVLAVGLSPEDADDVRQAARAFGTTAICVATPVDAIRALLDTHTPAAVITAPLLPGSDGPAFLDLVGRERPEVARILVTEGRAAARGTIPPPVGPRLLYRPWDAVTLGDALDAALSRR
jgi:hypothetical protein